MLHNIFSGKCFQWVNPVGEEKAITTIKKPGRPKGRKTYQVNVRFDQEFYERIKSAAGLQKHSDGQLCRILLEWALPFYERTRSVEALMYLSTKHFTSLVEKPWEQHPREQSLVAIAGR